jgi:hypothetical protein
MADTIDYAAILADLEAKKASLEAAIGAVRSAIAMGAAGQAGDFSAASPVTSASIPSLHNGEVPAGAFLGKSIPDAAKLYLEIVKKKQTSKEIADGLRRGGIESTSQNFVGIVHSILDRTRKTPNGGIVKLDRSTWGLTEWYPRGIASTAAPTKKSKGKKRSSKKAEKKRPEPSTISNDLKAGAPTWTPTDGSGFKERALALFRQNPLKEFSLEEIEKQTGATRFVLIMNMPKLVKASQVEKTASGYFRAASNLRQMPAANAAAV